MILFVFLWRLREVVSGGDGYHVSCNLVRLRVALLPLMIHAVVLVFRRRRNAAHRVVFAFLWPLNRVIGHLEQMMGCVAAFLRCAIRFRFWFCA